MSARKTIQHSPLSFFPVGFFLVMAFSLAAIAFSKETAQAVGSSSPAPSGTISYLAGTKLSQYGSSSPTPSGTVSSKRTKVNVSDYYKKGVFALEAEDYDTAEEAFRKVVKARSRDGDARAYLGFAQLGLSDYDDARKNLEKAVKYDTILPQAHEKLGLVYLYFEEPDKAKEQLAALVEMRNTCIEPCAFEKEIQQAHDALTAALAER